MYQIKEVVTPDIIQLVVTPFPDWQEFPAFVDFYLDKIGAEMLEKDSGMDRHQIRFKVDGERWLLQFEHYSESIWLEQE